MSEDITLESLVGRHILTGVDFNIPSDDPNASNCAFRLDGEVYLATEDPSDGYRSYLGTLLKTNHRIANSFPACKVLGRHKEDSDDLLVLTDVVTGKDVLTIGTASTDDYYPYYVANFQPENMAINK